MERHEAGLAPGEDALGKDRSCRGPPACCSTVPGVLGVLSPTARGAHGTSMGSWGRERWDGCGWGMGSRGCGLGSWARDGSLGLGLGVLGWGSRSRGWAWGCWARDHCPSSQTCWPALTYPKITIPMTALIAGLMEMVVALNPVHPLALRS